uniref:t-SNARE coiled-coil homology domain-containing protein n=1 Tax=Syphacia muris TaxID=451379 RepID=A0A0N5AQI3_9BILA
MLQNLREANKFDILMMPKHELSSVPESPHALDTVTSFKDLFWPVNYNSLIEQSTDESNVCHRLIDQFQTLDSTRRMVQLVEEANEFGVQSLTYLDEQDEKLHRIEGELTDIDEGMEMVKKDIFKMENCCRLFTKPREF